MNEEVIQQYVFTHFCMVYELPVDFKEDDVKKYFSLSPDAAQYFGWEKKSIPESIHVEIDGNSIPVLFPNDADGDFVASAFYFLSCYHEFSNYSGNSRTKSIETGPGFFEVVRIPVVNYYFAEIAKRMTEAGLKVVSRNEKPTLCLTHDIDRMNSGWLEGGMNAVKNLKLGKALKGLSLRLQGEDPWMNLSEIADEEERFQRTSTHFMLCRKSSENADYDVRSEKVQALIIELRNRGSEIGVHGSTGTHAAIPSLISDIESIGGPVHSNRFHFLHFDVRNTPNVLEEASLSVDSSLGFFDEIGFRTGFTYPHFLFNFERMEMSPVLEVPLNAMDTTFRKSNYLGTSIHSVPEVIDDLMKLFERHGGVFTLLWHNNYFSDFKFGEWKALYSEILQLAEGRFENSTISDAATKYANLK
ncbi:MAG: hypothetical protein HWE14_01690 [Flavobacteriia bacterium]|nr:hypothetical protein [Flavobacteriia bacterium]